MSITFGDAILWIRGKDDKLGDDLAKAEGKTNSWAKKVSNSLVMIGTAYTSVMISAVSTIITRGVQLEKMGNEIATIMSHVGDISAKTLAGFSEQTLKKMADIAMQMGKLSEDYAQDQERRQEELKNKLVDIAESGAKQLEEAAYDHQQRLEDITQQMEDLGQNYLDSLKDRQQELANQLLNINQNLKDSISDINQGSVDDQQDRYENYIDRRKELDHDLSRATTAEERNRIREQIAELDEDYQRSKARAEREVQQARERAEREAQQARERSESRAKEADEIAKREQEQAVARLQEKIAAENAEYQRQTQMIIAERQKQEQAAKESFDRETSYAKQAYDAQFAYLKEKMGQAMGDEIADPFFKIKAGIKELLDILGKPFMEDLGVVLDFIAKRVIPVLIDWADKFAKLPQSTRLAIMGFGLLIIAVGKLLGILIPLAAWLKIIFGGGAAAGAAGGGGLFAFLGTITVTVTAPLLALALAVGVLIAVWIIFHDRFLATVKMMAEYGPKIFIAMWKRILYEVKKFVTDFIDNIKKLGSMSLEEWKKVGKDIVDGIWKGISDAWEKLKTNFATAIKDLLKWIQEKLKIGSPSLVFATEVGAPMAQGVGMGFVGEMASQMQQMNRSLIQFGGGQVINTGNLEFHGRFSQAEMNYFDERQDAIVTRRLLKTLKGRRLP
jgi:hypothetical protein